MRNEIKTKRLLISPLTDEELEELIISTEDEGLKIAYSEMLEGAKEDVKNRNWYAPWKIQLKKERITIGYIGFKGPVKNDAVEIGYGIFEDFEGRGYTTEAATAVVEWAFMNENVFFVEAEAEKDNHASLRIIEKLAFKSDGFGEEGLRFIKERPSSSWGCRSICV